MNFRLGEESSCEECFPEFVDARRVVLVECGGLGDDIGGVASLEYRRFKLAPEFSEERVIVIGRWLVVEDRNANVLAGLQRLGCQAVVEKIDFVPCEVATVANAHPGAGGQDGEPVKIGL